MDVDSTPTPDPTPEPTETPEAPEETAPEGDGEASEEVPAWVKKELAKARSDAAKYRTSLREAEAKLSEAKTPEDLELAVREVRESNERLQRELLIRDVAAKHNLPPALAGRLNGATQEELEADAVELAKLVAPAPTAPAEPTGGLNPGAEDTEDDPRALARRYSRRL